MTLISHNRPCFGHEEEAAAVAALRSGWVAQGPQVAAFENEVCAFLVLPAGHGIAVSSGSAALYLALLALGAAGQKVIAPVYSCRAVLNAIELARATPIWADVGADGPNIELRSISSDSAPIAIVAHMFGLPAALPNRDTPVIIEDCAQAIGAEVAGRKVGTIGKVGVFSFGATKLMTTGGQGGMLVSRDSNVIDFVRKTRDYDTVPDAHPRFNLQMTDLQAAIGRAQLRKLSVFIERRKEIFARYRDIGFDVLDARSDTSPVRYRTVIRSSNPHGVINILGEHEIKAIVPVEDRELLGPADQFPNAAALTHTTVSLPTYPSLNDDELSRIVEVLRGNKIVQE